MTEAEIRLGMTNDLAGVGDTPYAAVSDALAAYFEKVNQDGGVCGRDLVLVTKDDQYNPELVLAKTKELVEQDGVLAILGALEHLRPPCCRRLPERSKCRWEQG